MKKLTFLLLLVLIILNTSAQTYQHTLEDKTIFDKLSGLPLSEKYGQVSSIKLVYEIKTKKLYYFNSKFFRYHHEFCSVILENKLEVPDFNKVNYSNSSKRKYLLANINYFKTLNIYALEISPVDLMAQKDIEHLWSLVKESSFIGKDLNLMLNNYRLHEISSYFNNQIPLLEPSHIYNNLNYQAIGKYKNCGIIHFIHNFTTESDNINPMDIAVLNETPLYLPKVSGIIVTEFQTPLSHLSILAQNRKIPIAAYKEAFNDSSLLLYANKKVCLTVENNTFKLEPIDSLIALKQKTKQLNLKYDLSVDSIIDIKYINKNSYKHTGNKAANFGLLHTLSNKNNFKVPEGAFAIPFYFYYQHVINSSAQALIDTLLNNKSNLSQDSIKNTLKKIRKEIKQKDINPELIKAVNEKIGSTDFSQFRFRSSTNAEDAKGFSGAGLYTSKTGILNHEKKSFEKAIKNVWASLWSYEAYSEREYYHINHKDVYMGILAHRAFPNEEVNGVAITKNLYRPDNFGFVINAQLGNENVVKPKQGTICDQFICYPNYSNNIFENKNTVDIITQSSLNDNKLLMSPEEIQNLANQLETIKKYFISHTFTSKSYQEFGLDIEFKLEGKNRDLYIKQVRVYND